MAVDLGPETTEKRRAVVKAVAAAVGGDSTADPVDAAKALMAAVDAYAVALASEAVKRYRAKEGR